MIFFFLLRIQIENLSYHESNFKIKNIYIFFFIISVVGGGGGGGGVGTSK